MLCEKCGGSVGANHKCTVCGHDNTAVDYTPVVPARMPAFRSTRITVLMVLVMVLDGLTAVINLASLFTDRSVAIIIVVAVLLCLSVSEIVICFFVLKMCRWALYAYIGFSVVGAVLQLLSLNFFAIIFKALLLYFVFRNDWDSFE